MAHLKGMREICEYARRTESTIIGWARDQGFPAKKLPGSQIWESDTDLIDEWRRGKLQEAAPPIEEIRQEVTRPDIKRKTSRRGR